MKARPVPVGTRVRAWAERHCSAEALDTLILPAIADLQYEEFVSTARPGIVRWAIRLRGYVGLGKALGVHLVNRRAASVNASEIGVSPVATAGGARSGIMSESSRNQLFMIGAGVLVAVVGFVAGRLSVPATAPSPMWETSMVSSAGASDDNRAIQRSIDEQRREATERDRRFQQQLDQQRYDAETDRVKAERARIDAETELASQQTQQLFEQRRQAAEVEAARLESARRDAYLELARQRTQQMLEEIARKR
jgi:hypothetical protein